MTRDEILSMAQKAGFQVGWAELWDAQFTAFAKLAITRHLANSPPTPLVVSMSDADQAQLRAWLVTPKRMHLVAAPDDSELATERAARQEAQQRLADLQEQVARSGLAHRLAVQRCVQDAVAEAVAAEREACKLICKEMETAMTDAALSHPTDSPERDACYARSRALMRAADAIASRGAP